MTLGSIIISNMVELLRRSQITSASPGWTNTVKDVIVSELGSDFDSELEASIKEKIEELKVTNPEIFEGKGKGTGGGSSKTKGLSEQNLAGFVRKGGNIVQNPALLIGEVLSRLPHAVLLTLAISLAPIIFDQLTKPGGPLDVRWRRQVTKEINAFLARQVQQDTEFGFRQVIVQSKKGFTATNGVNNYNTVRGIREGGLNKEREDRLGKILHQKGGLTFD